MGSAECASGRVSPKQLSAPPSDYWEVFDAISVGLPVVRFAATG